MTDRSDPDSGSNGASVSEDSDSGDSDSDDSDAPAHRWDPDRYDDEHAFVAEYGRDLLDLLAPEPGERVLDVGCGTGRLTRQVADAGAAVVGLDASAEMVERAREAHPDLRFVRGDAREFEADRPFDAVLSNAALHWIPEGDQPRVIDRIASAMRPGGRFVAEMGGAGNVGSIVDALAAELEAHGRDFEHPWYFPALGEYASLLESRGFEVTFARLFDRPTELDGGRDGLRNWLAMFAESTLRGVGPDEREAVVETVEERLRPQLFEPADDADADAAGDADGAASTDNGAADDEAGGTWTADYRRLRFVARRV